MLPNPVLKKDRNSKLPNAKIHDGAPAPILDKDIISVLVENSLPLTTICHVKPEIFYMLSRAQVAENYISFGEMGSTLWERIRIHKQHTNQPEYCKLKVSEHFVLSGKK